jgi:hypothetical protein
LAELTFEAIGTAGNTSPLVVTADPFADPGGQPLDVRINNGQIEIWSEWDHQLYLPLVRRD